MDSVELINTLTKEEAEKKYQEFVSAIKTNNRRVALTILITTLITAAVEVFAWFVLSGGYQSGLMIGCGVVAGIIIGCLLSQFNADDRFSRPPVYLYHKILEEYKVLRVVTHLYDDDTYSLIFDVANKAGEVSRKHIYGFKKVEKVGIDRTTADLVERKILVPYSAH